MPNENLIVMITGANSGLGLALCDTFIKRGHTVFGVIRDEASAKLTAISLGPKFIPIVTSVSEEQSIQDISSALLTTNSRIDILINNAGGTGEGHTLQTVSSENLLQTFNANCISAIRAVKGCINALMLSRRPTIVNISSRLASISGTADGSFDTIECSFAYHISKASLNMVSALLHREFRQLPIKTISISPGSIRTRINSDPNGESPEIAGLKIFEIVKNFENISSGSFISSSKHSVAW